MVGKFPVILHLLEAELLCPTISLAVRDTRSRKQVPGLWQGGQGQRLLTVGG
jgi:hypothetical protein